ncbi:MAG: DUF4301 family protein [Alphaproteobacteria bacterium]|nr:DUF4301 family protein [Alphaproteobacteria bacterium]
MSVRMDEATRAEIRAAGRDPDAAQGQLDRLLGPPTPTLLVRPATVGDGIRVIEDGQAGRLEAAHEAAARAGRLRAFVPASGAASRMFKDTVRAWQDGIASPSDGRLATAARDVLLHAPDLALWELLEEHGAVEGDVRSILGALHGALRAHELPKALVPFHPYPEGARTPLEEHLVEAARLVRDAEGVVRLHFTVGEAHRAAFEARVAEVRRPLETRLDCHFEVTTSVQDPSTDTVAVDRQGQLFRDDGAVLFRPGGHGALLQNLGRLGADVVLVKNIDNVVPDDLRGPNLPWRRRLSGLLLSLQAEAWDLVRRLRRGEAVEAAQAFVAHHLGATGVDGAEALLDRLHRPWRVAGMVRNQGQPGGGPFWAQSPDGTSLQIVEAAQVGPDAGQQAILGSSTHFNPVDMALGLLDADGRPFDLARFVDPDAVILADKSHHGRGLRALEHPGLWNGGMARWNTVFVEIPAATFQPVKTVADLLQCAHGGPLC